MNLENTLPDNLRKFTYISTDMSKSRLKDTYIGRQQTCCVFTTNESSQS